MSLRVLALVLSLVCPRITPSYVPKNLSLVIGSISPNFVFSPINDTKGGRVVVETNNDELPRLNFNY